MQDTTTWICSWLVVTVFVAIVVAPVCGQGKIEREFRIDPGEAPETAKSWLREAYGEPRKLKWYFEETSGKSSYEAKYVFDGAAHSVEFNLSGEIEDIEIETSWEELPEACRESISAYLHGTFKKYRIEKIQIQYTGAPRDLSNWAKKKNSWKIQTHYEIEYYGETDSSKQLWEGLFSETGALIRQREIPIPSTNHLFF